MIHVSELEKRNDEYKKSDLSTLTKRGLRTRTKLLNAAEKIFGEKSYYEASIVDITQQAKVAQGTFYIYFSSKKEIFEELIKKLSKDFRNEIRIEVLNAKNIKEAQIIGFKTFFRWVKEHRDLYKIVQQSVVVNEELHRWYYERVAQGYIKGIEEAMRGGEIRKLNPETVAYALMGISSFIGMRWVYWENSDVPDRVLEEAINAIFEGIQK